MGGKKKKKSIMDVVSRYWEDAKEGARRVMKTIHW